MFRRQFAIVAAPRVISSGAAAQDTVKIGLILPMTGPFGLDRQADRGRGQALHGAERRHRGRQEDRADPQGRRRRAPTPPSASRRNWWSTTRSQFLAGFGLTPLALATAPIATQAKVPLIVMAAATSIITEESPFIVRTSFTLPQVAVADGRLGGEERHQEGRDAGHRLRPGHRRREARSTNRLKAGGGRWSTKLRVPLRNPDFAPFLQRCATPSPTRCSCSCPPASARRS